MTTALDARHLAVIFDTRLNHDSWGLNLVKALRELAIPHVHYEPHEVPWTPGALSYAALNLEQAWAVLYIDDEMGWELPETTLPLYYWVIDSWRLDYLLYRGGTRRERVQHFQSVAWTQRKQARELNGTWVPVAVDTDLYTFSPVAPSAAEPRLDWCFIGHMNERRRELCGALSQVLPNCFFGESFRDDANRIYNRSRVALNLSEGGDINLRMFEAQATSALLLSSRVDNGEDELFSHLPVFGSTAECIARVQHWLERPEERRALSAAQAREVAEKHSWRERAQRLLAMAGLGGG